MTIPYNAGFQKITNHVKDALDLIDDNDLPNELKAIDYMEVEMSEVPSSLSDTIPDKDKKKTR